MSEAQNRALEEAAQSVRAAVDHARKDPLRPVVHFLPPAYWMNDPNGTIYHNGHFHLFYQHNPYGDTWGHIHWGHARSKDLVYWEHLPIALWPSQELGEEHCFSGCAAVDDAGKPLLFYTSVGGGESSEQRKPNAQWAATGDDDWISWQKHPKNPILSVGGQGAPTFDGDWRDPYIFEAGGRTFIVVGATLDATAGVALYEAEDDSLLHWRYRKLLYEKSIEEIRFFECPNFIPMGGEQFLLLTSPYTPVQYVVGRFDVATLTFTPEGEGVLDPGANAASAAHFYASNTAFAPAVDDAASSARCILFGWIRGFPENKGWNGCLALPRELWLGEDGHPRQKPVDELKKLRATHFPRPAANLSHGHLTLDCAAAATEVRLDICFDWEAEATDAGKLAGIALFGPQEAGEVASSIAYDGSTLWVAGQAIPYTLQGGTNLLSLHLFVDKSTLEVFVDDGRLAVTRVIEPPQSAVEPVLFVHGGSPDDRVRFENIHIWELSSIW
jgi:sucrose-6-phosphate hydrolase SacC (GH32 family)